MRAPLRGLATAFASAALVAASVLTPLTASAKGTPEARFDQLYQGFASPRTVLTDSTPAAAGLDPKPIDDALAQIAGWEEPSGTTHPLYAGAVTLLGHSGHVVAREASGYALRYADGAGTELAREQWVPMQENTIFDMASVSKLFTSILVVQPIERGAIRLEEPLPPTFRPSPRTARAASRCASSSRTRRASSPGCPCGAGGPTRPPGSRR